MPTQWTPEQLQAIEARGGSLLVSAAAGSGKTAVLVERVLRRLTDPRDPCGADELLIVTFTRAAAAQMRERIDAALGERLRLDPNNTALLRQQRLLPLAQICTIDSFCIRLVQEHAAARGLPQDVRMLDDSERMLLRAEAAEEALEAAYGRDEPAFRLLGLLLEVGGDDTRLQNLLQRAADMALASPSPEDWLDALAEEYRVPRTPGETPWGEIQLAEVAERLEFCAALAGQCLASLERDPPLRARYAAAFVSDLEIIGNLSRLARRGDWDPLREALRGVTLERIGAKPKQCDEALAQSCKARRNLYKEELKKLPELLCVSAAEHAQDMEALAPVAQAFAALARDIIGRCGEKKARRQAADFGDMLHWALDLLVAPGGERTALARQIGAQYREILVDEYQDINAAQGKLFEALSRDGKNLFLVGDVKQSIYRFRQASPELFLEKRGAYASYDGARYPACVLLGKNFRSRSGVTDAVNFTFRQLMSAKAAEIEYTREEELVCGAGSPPAEEPDTALWLLQYDAKEEDSVAAEARYIARWIAKEVESGRRRPRDFCILLRNYRKLGIVYAQALQSAGILAHAAESESLFQSREIQLLLSLLRIIDNPAQDVPLAAVLLSPIAGFGADDLARWRGNEGNKQRGEPSGLYRGLRAAGEACSAAFLERLAAWRRMAAICAPGDLVRWLLEETGLLAIAGAMRQPARRRANLHRLAQYALDYGERPGAALSGFLRYMQRVEAGETLLAVSVVSESADVVRVMSVHKAKGLEFPVCVLAQCAHRFNLMDIRADPLLLHARTGLGLQRPEPENRRRLPTLPHAALQTAIRRGALAEELRLLYVAMTRAKEQLVLLVSDKDPQKKLLSAAAKLDCGSERIPPVMVRSAGSFADWLLSAALRHPDAHALREAAQLGGEAVLPAQERMAFVMAQSLPAAGPVEALSCECQIPEPPPELAALVRERLEYRYPYAALSRLAAKRAVSELTEQAQQEAFAFSSRPAFLRADSVTAAQRGTAMHAFLQFADYKNASENLADEISRLQAMGYLSQREADALERGKLERFFAGGFAKRMLNAKLMREKKFTLRILAGEFALDDPLIPLETVEGESVVVQGIIDCAFEEDGRLILLDYKTDRVEALDVLRERYAEQLRLYRRAMKECFGKEVSETLIYSFWLGEFLAV